PLVLEAAMDPAHPLKIFGSDYPTPDGTAIRDYIHVTDLAVAHVRAFRYMNRRSSGALNLGTGRGYSVREIIAAVQRITACPISAIEAPRRAGDPPCLVASNHRATSELRWEPKKGLDEIIRTAWQWRISLGARLQKTISRA